MTDLAYLPAADALALFRARELSPVELLEAVIARAEHMEPTVNALCHTFYEQARQQARAAEERYGGRGPAPRPLEGIPLAVKEEEPIAGQPWTQASLIDADAVADRSSTFAQRILDSGAIVHARTTMPEFGSAAFTRSHLWGVTRNPWNPAFAAGGSSGGAGAALASGTTTLASGSDIAGSIRIPASFNGVVGFKPSRGRVPVDPPFNHDPYFQTGPMARTVADAALFFNAVSGPDDHDITTLRPRLELPVEPSGVAGLRVALAPDLGGWPLDAEVRANTLAVGEALRAAGAEVVEVDLELSRDAVNRAGGIHFSQGIAFLEEIIAAHPGKTTNYLVHNLERLRRESAGGTVVEGWAIESDLYRRLAAVHREFDVLICATVGTAGFDAEEEFAGEAAFDVAGETLADPLDAVLTLPFNIMSACPVLAVPSGFAGNGVPTGVQIVGRTYDDVTVFRVGAALERVRPFTTLGA